MYPAPSPANEPRRLALLQSLDILDTGKEEAFDDLVAMASQVCRAPIALVSLVDANRQWFKARIGLAACETGRHESFCAHAVHSGAELIVPDALADERFHDSPLVQEAPHIRFYAGVPLTMDGGEVLGTLCVIDTVPRALEPEQLDMLRRLGRQATRLLEARSVMLQLDVARHDLQQRESIFERALRAAGEAMWDWNVPQRRVTTAVSHGALLGYAPGELVDAPDLWRQLMHPDDVDPTVAVLREHLNGLTSVYEADYRMRHRQGHWVWVRSRGEVVERSPDGKPLRMLGTVADISQRKALEDRIKNLNARLASEADQARSLAESKARFVATMAHEIRTPLNSIVGASVLALSDADAEAQRENLELVNEAAANLARLVDGILDFSRLDSGRVDLEVACMSVQALLKRMQELFRPQAQAKGLIFHSHVDPQVPTVIDADTLRIEQVLTNLLGNAFKFTKSGRVDLMVMRRQADGVEQLVFEVLDSGVGIASDRMASLFKPFAQADETISRQFGGTGLGLVISRQLARLMGGDVTLRSDRGLGTQATFWLPLRASARPAPTTPSVPTDVQILAVTQPAVDGMRVLIVDDNPMNLQVLERMLRRAGVFAITANSARQALTLLAHESVDAVLMDLYMPEMSGAEATRVMRARPQTADIPVIAVSASVTPEERAHCLAAGMVDFVAKPVRASDLLKALAACRTPAALGF